MNEIIRNRKGLSPIFLSVYLALMTILLVSTLFLALDISRSALTVAMRIEQERIQEKIELTGPGALNLTQGSIVETLRVNNAGAITVRIRALYINHVFVCDPSEFTGDSYIAPKESLWINLTSPNVDPPIVFNTTTMNADWTVTTERGTRASEIGWKLWTEEPGSYTPNKFYYGPLMIIFDMFHWRSGTGPWTNGWTIPKNTPDVTWRILVMNIDDRPIKLEKVSCFTLISNDNDPQAPMAWYIDPEPENQTLPLHLEPYHLNFLLYSWNKPYDPDKPNQRVKMSVKEDVTNVNFLTFYGHFVEADGTLTTFGQTVPFEAVLVT